MNIYCATQGEIWARRHDFHVLTYAEEGFAPLNIHVKDTGVTKEHLLLFTDAVNVRDEIGTLLPMAPISAVPRNWIRGFKSIGTLCEQVASFLLANEQHVFAKKILVDFRVPQVPQPVIEAVFIAAEKYKGSVVDEICVLRAY